MPYAANTTRPMPTSRRESGLSDSSGMLLLDKKPVYSGCSFTCPSPSAQKRGWRHATQTIWSKSQEELSKLAKRQFHGHVDVTPELPFENLPVEAQARIEDWLLDKDDLEKQPDLYEWQLVTVKEKNKAAGMFGSSKNSIDVIIKRALRSHLRDATADRQRRLSSSRSLRRSRSAEDIHRRGLPRRQSSVNHGQPRRDSFGFGMGSEARGGFQARPGGPLNRNMSDSDFPNGGPRPHLGPMFNDGQNGGRMPPNAPRGPGFNGPSHPMGHGPGPMPHNGPPRNHNIVEILDSDSDDDDFNGPSARPPPNGPRPGGGAGPMPPFAANMPPPPPMHPRPNMGPMPNQMPHGNQMPRPMGPGMNNAGPAQGMPPFGPAQGPRAGGGPPNPNFNPVMPSPQQIGGMGPGGMGPGGMGPGGMGPGGMGPGGMGPGGMGPGGMGPGGMGPGGMGPGGMGPGGMGPGGMGPGGFRNAPEAPSPPGVTFNRHAMNQGKQPGFAQRVNFPGNNVHPSAHKKHGSGKKSPIIHYEECFSEDDSDFMTDDSGITVRTPRTSSSFGEEVPRKQKTKSHSQYPHDRVYRQHHRRTSSGQRDRRPSDQGYVMIEPSRSRLPRGSTSLKSGAGRAMRGSELEAEIIQERMNHRDSVRHYEMERNLRERDIERVQNELRAREIGDKHRQLDAVLRHRDERKHRSVVDEIDRKLSRLALEERDDRQGNYSRGGLGQYSSGIKDGYHERSSPRDINRGIPIEDDLRSRWSTGSYGRRLDQRRGDDLLRDREFEPFGRGGASYHGRRY